MKQTCGIATEKKIRAVGETISNMIPLAEKAKSYFGLQSNPKSTRKTDSGQQTVKILREQLNQIFLEKDGTGEYTLISPSEILYIAYYDRHIDKALEKEEYPSQIIENAAAFVPQYVRQSINTFTQLHQIEHNEPQQNNEEDPNEVEMQNEDDQFYFNEDDAVFVPNDEISDEST